MKQRIRDLSLKYKISMLNVALAVIPLLCFALATTFLFERAILRRSNKHIEENSRIMASQAEAVFRDAELCSNYLTLNISDISNAQGSTPARIQNGIQAEMNTSMLIFHGISSIVYVGEDGMFLSTQVALYDNQAAIESSSYLETLHHRNGKTVLFDMTDDCMSVDGSSVVTEGKRVINTVTGRTIGYLFLNLNMEYLRQSVYNEISYYLLYDAAGNCVGGAQGSDFLDDAAVQQTLFASDAATLRSGRDTYLVARCGITGCGWTVIGATNLNEFNVSASEMAAILLGTGLIMLALLALELQLAANYVTRPLLQLTSGAEKIAQGDLNVQFAFRTQDEIGHLGTIFNRMTARIRELLARVDAEAAQKRQYELSLILEQVKPHFLYNTLDIIIMLIDMNKSREAQRVTRKLASYYRNSLSESQEVIPLERELAMVEDYLELQQMRYGDKFTFDIEADPALSAVPVPKMTLQPLVENAIYHGLKYKEEWGNIHIGVRRAGEAAELVVADNGIGMQPEKLREIQDQSAGPQHHFGVYSVDHRLRLYFGAEYGLSVASTYGSGTTVTLRIPLRQGGGTHA